MKKTRLGGLVWALLALVLAGATRVTATDPASAWSVPGQVRTHTCAPVQGPTAALLFPDGTPTGFYAYANDPSKNGSAPDCALGTVEIDAQEVLTNGAGWQLYFHPGGGPDLYNDYVNDGQYGHIRSTDFTVPPALAPLNLNGKPCTPATPGVDANFLVNLIGVADDGAIYVGNLTSASFPPQFVLYRWANEAAPQTVVFSGDPSNGDTNFINQQWGDTLAVRGAGTNTQVLIASRGTLAAILRPTDASMTAFSATTLNTDVSAGHIGGGVALGVADTFWATAGGAGQGPLSHLSFNLNTGTAATLQAFDATNFPSTISAIAFFTQSNLLAGLDVIPGPDLLRLYDLSGIPSSPVLVDREPWATSNTNTNLTGALAFDGTNRLYALDSENGLMAFTLATVSTNTLPPTVFLQPVSLTVQAGSNATFTAAADGSPPLSFQWLFGSGSPLPGRTSASLSLSNVQIADAGSYSLRVSNSCGAVTSSVATLTIIRPPESGPPGLLAYEPFPYNPGSVLAGQGGWLLNSGTSGTIQSGSLPITGLAAPGSNHLAWTSASMSLRLPVGTNTAGALYFSFVLRVDSLGTAASDTLAGFTTGTTTTFAPKLNIASNSFGAYNLGIYKSSGLTTGTLATNVFTTNDVVFVVARYTFNTNSATDDTCDLWLYPDARTFGATDAPAPAVAAIGAGRTDMTQIDRFFFRSAGPALLCEAGDLRVGTTWASVTPLPPANLYIALTNHVATLSWPTNPPAFVLQESSNLVTAPWTLTTNPASVTGASNRVTVTATNASRFYRLRR